MTWPSPIPLLQVPGLRQPSFTLAATLTCTLPRPTCQGFASSLSSLPAVSSQAPLPLLEAASAGGKGPDYRELSDPWVRSL